uniref:Uncharacterized protein n=1 Tax=Anguilla anguilla TaxID=7936 RepID=A0A0E9QMK5_ANGAN
MAKQPYTSLRSPCAMPSIGWNGAKCNPIGLRAGSSGVMHHTIRQSDESGFWWNAQCQMYWPK